MTTRFRRTGLSILERLLTFAPQLEEPLRQWKRRLFPQDERNAEVDRLQMTCETLASEVARLERQLEVVTRNRAELWESEGIADEGFKAPEAITPPSRRRVA